MLSAPDVGIGPADAHFSGVLVIPVAGTAGSARLATTHMAFAAMGAAPLTTP
jgi:hypothetical protein